MEITRDAITTVLAVWGAVLATVALIWNILRDRKDKAVVEVSGAYGFTVGIQPSLDTFSVDAVNLGRRPVQIVEVAYETDQMPPGTRAILNTSPRLVKGHIPAMLREGEALSLIIARDSLPSGRLRALYVKDVAGRKWKASQKNLRQLNGDA